MDGWDERTGAGGRRQASSATTNLTAEMVNCRNGFEVGEEERGRESGVGTAIKRAITEAVIELDYRLTARRGRGSSGEDTSERHYTQFIL